MSSSLKLEPLFDLARGGMGVVSVAMRVEGTFRRLYVVKRLLPELLREQSTRDMFVEEARIAGHLHHPNIVGVLDVGTDRRGPYLVMEYIDGLTAHELLKQMKGEFIPLQVALELSLDITRGLAAAHEATDSTGKPLRIIHRDVSPQNVLIGFDGTARLSDFGIARAAGRTNKTATGVLKGKLGYMAPEQLRFDPPSTHTDLFSLGVVIYELLTGSRLYPLGADGVEGPKRILSEAPPDLGDTRPDVPDALVQLMFELLAKSPEQRPPSARDVEVRLAEALADVRGGEATSRVADFIQRVAKERRATRDARIEKAIAGLRPKRRRPLLWAAGLLAIVGAGATLRFGMTQRQRPSAEATETAGTTPSPPQPTSVFPAPTPVPLVGEEPTAPEPAATVEAGPATPEPGVAVMEAGRMRRARPARMQPVTPMVPEPERPTPTSRMGGAGTWDWEEP